MTIYKYLEYFSSRSHEVVLMTFAEEGEEIALDKVSHFCKKVILVQQKKTRCIINCLTGLMTLRPLQVSYYLSKEMQSEVKKQLNEIQFDILYAHTIRMANYLTGVSHPGKVLAMQISMGLTFRRLMTNSANPAKKLFAAAEYLLVRNYEVELTKKFSFCCIISNTDLGEMEKRQKIPNVFINPHGVDHRQFSYFNDVDKRDKFSLIFSGNMGYFPNVDAVEYFVSKILPLILEKCPQCKFYIVGRRPAPSVIKLEDHPNIEVTGEVPDMGEYLRKATIGINPMRVGSGLQNKVIEGLASGLPLVVSSVANEGIGAQPDTDLFVADTPQGFAEKTLQLLNNSQLRQTLASNGRKFIERQYTWEYFLQQLEEKMMTCIPPTK